MEKTLLILCILFAAAGSVFGQSRQVTADPGTGVLKWPSSEVFRAANQIPEKARFAVFTIPVTGAFTDFELKASDDNYETMVFFYHSPDPEKSSIPQQIWTTRPDVFFTDSQHPDRRQWIRQSATQSISAMRANGNSRIGGIVVVVRDMGRINPDNLNLVWTYCLMTPTSTEDDPGGRSIWRPIVPVWQTQSFEPIP